MASRSLDLGILIIPSRSLLYVSPLSHITPMRSTYTAFTIIAILATHITTDTA
jgi:hypothetical protein